MANLMLVNGSLVTQILDKLGEVVKGIDPSIPVRFEELTAEAGELPRMMMSLVDSGEEESRYISGEAICPIAFALTLRVSAEDEQDRLDAAYTLNAAAAAFIKDCSAFDGFVAYKRPLAGVAHCLGRTDAFEDWQITFSLKYKETR